MVSVLAGWGGEALWQTWVLSPALAAATAAAAAAAPITCSWWRRIAAAAASAAIASACSQARRRRAATLKERCWWRAELGARWRLAAAAGQIVDVRPPSDVWCRTGPAQQRHSNDEESARSNKVISDASYGRPHGTTAEIQSFTVMNIASIVHFNSFVSLAKIKTEIIKWKLTIFTKNYTLSKIIWIIIKHKQI